MKDYYGLAGVFASVHYKSYPLVSEEVVEDFERQKKENRRNRKGNRGFS